MLYKEAETRRKKELRTMKARKEREERMTYKEGTKVSRKSDIQGRGETIEERVM